MAGLATEAAFFGKPSLVGGYGVKKFSEIVPLSYLPPVKHFHPDRLYETINSFLDNETERNYIGKAAKKFVRNEWNPDKVTEKYITFINGEISKIYWLDPYKINYFEGGGIDKKTLIKNLLSMINNFGIKSLCLSKIKEQQLISFLQNLEE